MIGSDHLSVMLAFERQKLMHRVVSQKMSYKADLEGELERYWAYLWVTHNFFRKSTWAQP